MAIATLARVACGQGVLIVTDTSERVTLPRPLVRTKQPPRTSYKIKEVIIREPAAEPGAPAEVYHVK